MALISSQVDKIMLDTGVVYVNGSMLSPCEGDNSFVVEIQYRDIPFNGMAGKTKGLKRVLRENAILTVHPKGLTQATLKMALPGADLSSGVIESGGGRQVIDASEYIDEVTLVGDMKDGNTKVITLFNALADNGLTITASEDSEAILELAFSAHYDPDALTDPIYSIEDATDYGS